MQSIADYRITLKDALERRCRENPRYSLRAFARDLAISPGRLSLILNGRQGLSRKSAARVAERLGLNLDEIARFCDQVEAADGRSRVSRKAAAGRLSKSPLPPSAAERTELDEDTLRVVSDWHHFALLELIGVKGFKNDRAWIARRLGISVHEAAMALERLKRVGLMEESRTGKLRPTHQALTTTNGIPSEAIRRFNRQILDKASRAVVLQTVEERDLSTLTIAVRSSDLPVVREMIKGFRRELNAYLDQSAPSRERDEVYSLAIQFFRLTEKESP